MKRTTLSLPDNVAVLAEREACRRGVSLLAIMRQALAEHLGLAAAAPRALPFARLGSSGQRHTARDLEMHLAMDKSRAQAPGASRSAGGGSACGWFRLCRELADAVDQLHAAVGVGQVGGRERRLATGAHALEEGAILLPEARLIAPVVLVQLQRLIRPPAYAQ
jgi:hypothetical protein